jgi:hypothetical protein
VKLGKLRERMRATDEGVVARMDWDSITQTGAKALWAEMVMERV